MDRTYLSNELLSASQNLVRELDRMDFNAQGAIWLYNDHFQEWRFHLISALVDTIGRKDTYKLLIRAFEINDFPEQLTLDDIYLASPHDSLFQLISRIVHVENGGVANFQDCTLNGTNFEGTVLRCVTHIPDKKETKLIQRKFEKNIRELESV